MRIFEGHWYWISIYGALTGVGAVAKVCAYSENKVPETKLNPSSCGGKLPAVPEVPFVTAFSVYFRNDVSRNSKCYLQQWQSEFFLFCRINL